MSLGLFGLWSKVSNYRLSGLAQSTSPSLQDTMLKKVHYHYHTLLLLD